MPVTRRSGKRSTSSASKSPRPKARSKPAAAVLESDDEEDMNFEFDGEDGGDINEEALARMERAMADAEGESDDDEDEEEEDEGIAEDGTGEDASDSEAGSDEDGDEDDEPVPTLGLAKHKYLSDDLFTSALASASKHPKRKTLADTRKKEKVTSKASSAQAKALRRRRALQQDGALDLKIGSRVARILPNAGSASSALSTQMHAARLTVPPKRMERFLKKALGLKKGYTSTAPRETTRPSGSVGGEDDEEIDGFLGFGDAVKGKKQLKKKKKVRTPKGKWDGKRVPANIGVLRNASGPARTFVRS